MRSSPSSPRPPLYLAGDDYLAGGSGADTLFGGARNDVLDGGAGIDKLYGEAGDDQLFGGTGNDILWGDKDASLYAPDMAWQNINGWTVQNRRHADGPNVDQYANGLGGNDLMVSDATYLNAAYGALNTLRNDRFLGGAGNDWLYGGDGRDTLEGGAGNDMLTGGPGADIIDGGAGDDIVLSFIEGSVPFSYNSDKQWNDDQKDWSWEVTDLYTDPDPTVLNTLFIYFAGDERQKTLFVDFYDFTGLIDPDGMPEPPQNEIIHGGSGNDYLDGGSGNDFIDGGTDHDKIIGVGAQLKLTTRAR